MTIIGIIPARWASTRLTGKVLADIKGKPMIQHVWERAKQCATLTEVYIACDHETVLKAAEKFGARAIMTSPQLNSGTDRIARAARDLEAGIVVNIQGDEPLVNPGIIDAVTRELVRQEQYNVATPIRRITCESDIANPAVVKVVVDRNGCALYFSRSAIPFNRDNRPYADTVYYKHLGIYAYRRDFLLAFNRLPASQLEQTEKLEQLRVLEAGEKILTVETRHDTVGVDTAQDLERVIALMDQSSP